MRTCVLDADNNPVPEVTPDGSTRPLTMQTVLRGAFNSSQTANEMNTDEKIQAFNLMVRPTPPDDREGVVDFTPEEVGFVLTWVKKQRHFSPLIVGRFTEFMNKTE